MAHASSRVAIIFSSLGHLYVHICTAFYFVIVLALEVEWQMPYHELIALWTLGSLLVGVGALPAGLLADRLGAPFMMVVFFLGLGACAIGAGLSNSSDTLLVCLSGIGLFASIYHPVGIPWLVRSAQTAKGRALGFNGVFGNLGAAAAGIIAGVLIDLVDWRTAFALPGAAGILIGLILLWFVSRKKVQDLTHSEADVSPKLGERVRVYVVLLITMFLTGLVFNATQTALPKVFAERAVDVAGQGTFGVGLLVGLVYGIAGIMQVLGGYLADVLPLRVVYGAAFLVQTPLLLLAADLVGISLVAVATLVVVANVSGLPAENLLLANYTPSGRHGLVFGLKFVVSFGAAPIGVQIVALVVRETGGFDAVFWALAAMALSAFIATLAIPKASAQGPALRRALRKQLSVRE